MIRVAQNEFGRASPGLLTQVRKHANLGHPYGVVTTSPAAPLNRFVISTEAKRSGEIRGFALVLTQTLRPQVHLWLSLGMSFASSFEAAAGGAAACEQTQDQMEQPLRFFHDPRVKSGNFTGALPWATEVLLKGAGADQDAPSYTSMSGGSPSR